MQVLTVSLQERPQRRGRKWGKGKGRGICGDPRREEPSAAKLDLVSSERSGACRDTVSTCIGAPRRGTHWGRRDRCN